MKDPPLSVKINLMVADPQVQTVAMAGVCQGSLHHLPYPYWATALSCCFV